MRKKLTALIVFVILLTSSLISSSLVYAGIFERTYVDDSSITGAIDNGVWYSPASNPGVVYNNGIEFNENSTQDSSLFVRTRLESYVDAGFEKFFDAEVDFLIESIPTDVKFGLVFARNTLLAKPVVGRANSSFVYFTKTSNSLCAGISKFDASGNEVSVYEPTDISDWVADSSKTFTMKLSVSSVGGINLNLEQDGETAETFYDNPNAALPVHGYIGFGQTGNASEVKITHVKIDALYNNAPENSNVYEDFSLNSFNLHEFYTRAPAGNDSYIKAEGGKLNFKNVTNGYLSTRKIYSNFEITASIPYISREPIFDENWNLVTPNSSGITFSLGVDALEAFIVDGIKVNIFAGGGDQAKKATHTIVSITQDHKEKVREILPSDLHVFDGSESGNKPIWLKLKNTDGVISLYIKIGDADFVKAIEYDCGENLEGYVRLSGYSLVGRTSSFEVDSLVLVNTDYKGNIAYISSKDSAALNKDFDYIDTWDDNDLLFPESRK